MSRDGGGKGYAASCESRRAIHAKKTYIEGAAGKWRTNTSPTQMIWEELYQWRGGGDGTCKNTMQCFHHMVPLMLVAKSNVALSLLCFPQWHTSPLKTAVLSVRVL